MAQNKHEITDTEVAQYGISLAELIDAINVHDRLREPESASRVKELSSSLNIPVLDNGDEWRLRARTWGALKTVTTQRELEPNRPLYATAIRIGYAGLNEGTTRVVEAVNVLEHRSIGEPVGIKTTDFDFELVRLVGEPSQSVHLLGHEAVGGLIEADVDALIRVPELAKVG